jgi:hypothetical protein
MQKYEKKKIWTHEGPRRKRKKINIYIRGHMKAQLYI